MSQFARATDWKTKPLPDEPATLDFIRVFSLAEFDRVKIGLVPQAMEDKWFIYFDDGALHIHRSWTGHQVYKVTIAQEADAFVVTEAVINPQFTQGSSYDVALLHYLIDRLLLGKKVPFPVPPYVSENDSAIYKHSVVGHATPNTISTGDRLAGCLAGGAIGDAVGSFYEGRAATEIIDINVVHGITDDTQLTLATCESIIESGQMSAPGIAKQMLAWYNKGKLTGLGASTLKALRDLQVGAHWALAGRVGEYAAGNGAAMRIAPLAFFVDPGTDRQLIRDVCNITHKNDEAYVGSLAVIYCLHCIIKNKWPPDVSLIELITPQLPDTAVRDKLLQLQAGGTSLSIRQAAALVGTSGHVIQSVPFAIFAAGKIRESSFEEILVEIIRCGGDTDTNASIAGQIMGAFTGLSKFSKKLADVFGEIKEFVYIIETARKLSGILKEQ